MSFINNLPEELCSYVLRFLETPPRSTVHATEVPNVEHLSHGNTPLKYLSLVNSSWRRIVFPVLFRHLKVRLCEILPPAHYCPHVHLCDHDELSDSSIAAEFIAFATQNELSILNPTLTIYQADESSRLSALGHRSRWKMWQRVLSALVPTRLIIIAPPRSIADLAGRWVMMNDAWAFKITHQRLELAVPPLAAGKLAATKPWHDCSDSSPFDFLPWDTLIYHGGSCLPVFGEYHYFEKHPPCILTGDELTPFRSLTHHLTRLSYAAVFPHLIHMQALVRAITSLTHLRTLTLQLTPTRASTILDDIDLIGRGNLNLRDCWTEVERSYATIIAMCARAGHKTPLRSPFSHWDIDDLRPDKTEVVLLPRLERLVSRDVGEGVLEAEVCDLFERYASGWRREQAGGGGVWSKREADDDRVGGPVLGAPVDGDELMSRS